MGANSNALWSAWGNLEWKQAGDLDAAAYCFRMALQVYPRSRYATLSLAMMEKATGNPERARELLQRGARYNPTDAAIRQARSRLRSHTVHACAACTPSARRRPPGIALLLAPALRMHVLHACRRMR
jgi:Flp pilus assembly protein TadD